MFRFTIRDLLWLMVVVAVFGGWCLDKRKYEMWIQRLESQIELLKGQ